MITTTLPIETPEGITFTYELASLTDRGKAYLLDLIIRLLIMAALGAVVVLIFGGAVPAAMGILIVINFFLEWGYYVLFETRWDGQSPGKRMLALRVVKSAGHPIGFYDSVLRNLLRAADILPLSYSVGALSMLATHKFQRLGDLAADTVVIRERMTGYADPQPVLQSALPTEQTVHGIALSHRERRLLQEFLARKDRLLPGRYEELAALLAERYRVRFGLPRTSSAATLLEQLYLGSQRTGSAR